MRGAEEQTGPIIPDGTILLLHLLVDYPTADVRCSLAPGDPAVAVYKTPAGCTARPDDRWQALCLQHIETDGLRAGAWPVLDLTENEAWSQHAGLGELPLCLGYDALQLNALLAEIIQPGEIM